MALVTAIARNHLVLYKFDHVKKKNVQAQCFFGNGRRIVVRRNK